ncbi:MAG: GntR family transcriptional regulator [Proteobacteria bacterium]|nr:GntR family transcriptional regulator [Pseudomonadota bacterium]
MLKELAKNRIFQKSHRYAEVARRLEQQIRDGGMVAGSRILGERELAKVLGVSRVTLRRALCELRDRGILVSDEAKGWFVAPPNVSEQNVLRSFSEMAAARGLSSGSLVIRSVVRIASFEEAEMLSLPAGAKVFDLERVRTLVGEPVGIENSLIPLQRAPALPATDFARQSLYTALRDAGAAPAVANYVLSATAASTEHAHLLNVPEGTALLAANAIARDSNGVPVELSKTVFRGDRYRFLTTLRAEQR